MAGELKLGIACKRYRKKAILLVFSAMLAYGASASCFQLMLIQGQSMAPAYRDCQLTVLDKWTKGYKAGDVVAFRCEAVGALLVKRIVAVPGDTVQIRDGVLYVNGLPDAGALPHGKISYAGIAKGPVTLLGDEFFVLGDNYAYSKDSRYKEIGCVREGSIVGKVFP